MEKNAEITQLTEVRSRKRIADTLKGQPHQTVHPLRCFRGEPDEHQFVDCRSNIESLRDEEYAGALLSNAPEGSEVSRHRTDIM
jgi:hypothetical protein